MSSSDGSDIPSDASATRGAADPDALNTTMPADEVLPDSVLNRLAALNELATHGPAESLLPLAGAELSRLANGWRLLLTVHLPGSDRRCRACPGSSRRRQWPCRVWLLAYQHLIGERLPQRSRRPWFPPITR